MLTIHGKKRILQAAVCSFLTLVAGASLITIVRNIKSNVDAISADGQNVTVTDGGQIDYGSGDGHFTRDYRVQVDGREYVAFCGEPSKGNADGTRQAELLGDSDENNEIKYLIYLYSAGTTEAQNVMGELYDWIGTGSLYAYVHATIGHIYAGDDKGLSASEVENIQGVISQIDTLIQNRDLTWLIAKKYQLYGIKKGEQEIEHNTQNLFWIENNARFGTLTVQKCDSDTGECVAQAGASLAGITFNVYNNAGTRIEYDGRVLPSYDYNLDDNSAALIVSGQTDQSGQVVFQNIPIGNILVEEVRTNGSYNLTAESQPVEMTTDGASVQFFNEVKRGNLVVRKVDRELNACDSLGAGSFSGVSVNLVNSTGHAIVYNGKTVGNGQMVDFVVSFSADYGCSRVFENLPYGTYTVNEFVAGTGYLLNSTEYTVNDVGGSNEVEVTIPNQIIRGDVSFRKVNQQTSEGMANIPFRITSTTTGESHIVVSDASGVVDTRTGFAAHSNHTNGYDDLDTDNITHQGFGTWFGKSVSGEHQAAADDTLGALPYDTYEIIELRCSANSNCIIDESTKKTFSVRENNANVDLGLWVNDCPEYRLDTVAVDNADSDKFIAAKSENKVKDTVTYCARQGVTYTVKGVLMDKATGQPLLVNGSPVEARKTITPQWHCGTTELMFDIDASELLGKSLVAFEYLYEGDQEIISHTEIDDEDQTIYVIGVDTTATDEADGDKLLAVDSDVKVRDIVKYCLVSDTEFTLRGVVMDKTAKGPLMIDDNLVEQIVTITPEESCGELEMIYPINTKGLGGAELIVFEEVYLGDKAEGTPILTNYDYDNEAEAIAVVPDVADTGLGLMGEGRGIVSHLSPAVFVVISGAGLFGGRGLKHYLARRRFLRGRR